MRSQSGHHLTTRIKTLKALKIFFAFSIIFSGFLHGQFFGFDLLSQLINRPYFHIKSVEEFMTHQNEYNLTFVSQRSGSIKGGIHHGVIYKNHSVMLEIAAKF